MSEERITIDDIRAAGHCPRGIKNWFDEQHLDFRTFLKKGISVEEFLATGDGHAINTVRVVRERRGMSG